MSISKVTLTQFDATGAELDRLSIQPPLTGVLLGAELAGQLPQFGVPRLLGKYIESDSGAVIDADFEFYWMPEGGRIEIAADPLA